jgi:DNA-binding SARP family transcriptional activator
MVELKLLGGLAVESPAGPLTGVAAQRKRLALLAILATARAPGVSREKLLGYLWPESGAERARHQLSSAIYELRRALGDAVIVTQGDDVRLNSEVVRSDVGEMEAARASGDLRRAVGLYRGPFLDGFFLSGTPEFERWVDRERDRLADHNARALEELAGAAEQRGDPVEAVQWWKARAAQDPYDTRVAVRLILALEVSGNRAGALQHAAVHERLLRDELGLDTVPEVAALAERLRDEPLDAPDAATAAPTSAAPPDQPGRPGVYPPPAQLAEAAAALQAPEPESRRRAVPAEAVRAPAEGRSAHRGAPGLRLGRAGTALGLLVVGAMAVPLAAFWLGRDAIAVPDQRGVAVARYDNRTGDPALDPVGSMAADWIARELTRTGSFDVVPIGMGVNSGPDRTNSEHDPANPDPGLAPEATDAALVVSGAYYQRGDSLEFHTQLLDARHGRLLRTLEPVSSVMEDAGGAIAEVSRRAAAAVVVALDTRFAAIGNLASEPANPEAYHVCLEGLDRFFAADWPAATRHFEHTLRLDPNYLFAELHIGFVRLNVGDFAGADSIARIVDRSRESLRPFERAILDLLRAYVAEDPVAAYEAARAAATIGPGSPPHVQWGSEALGLNRPREAIRILSAIDPTIAPVGGWPVYWEALTGAHHAVGDHREELRQARRARALYPDEPWALRLEARSLAALGRLAEVEGLVGLRRSLPAHRDPDLGALLETVGRELRVHGHAEAGADLLRRATEWHAARAAEPAHDPGLPVRHGLALLHAGMADEAEVVFRQLAAADPEHIVARGVVGMLAARRGDHGSAARAMAWLESAGRPYRFGEPLLWRACIAAESGDLRQAVTLLQDAAGRAARFEHTHVCLDALRDYRPFVRFAAPKG